ncbi:MAG TPA: hypothetical protein VGF53_04515 [Pseudolabrys sp.]|jgi:hypothetical protein
MKIVPGKLEALPEAAADTIIHSGRKGAFPASEESRVTPLAACSAPTAGRRWGIF